VLNCSTALLNRVIVLCRSRGCPQLTRTDGVWKYAVMRDTVPSGRSRVSSASAWNWRRIDLQNTPSFLSKTQTDRLKNSLRLNRYADA